jgi:hypothetical protein
MKLALSYVGVSLTFVLCHAFAPQHAATSFVITRNTGVVVQPTAVSRVVLSSSNNLDDLSLEEEVEVLVQEEISKTAKFSNLRNAKGVEYAPWMKMSEEDENRIRNIMREKAAVRRTRKLQEQNVQGALLRDSQGQELSGVGLRSTIIDNEDVELEWATAAETSTKGFIVKRRAAKTDDFTVLASYESYGPLQSKGKDGGVYRFLDKGVGIGGWVYRVTECESNGNENDLSQCLVEITSKEEQQVAVLGLAAFAAVAVASVVAGFLLDPVQY